MQPSYLGLNTRALLISGLIAGVGIGLLSHIPLVSCVNCLLLGWVWGGGIGAVYLYRQNEHQPYLTTTQGLVIGAVAGVIGAIIGAIAGLLLGGLTAAFTQAVLSYTGRSDVNVLPNLLVGAGFSVLRLILDIFLYAIVGAIGGLIATALIWKAPVAPLAPPPPYNPPPAGPVV